MNRRRFIRAGMAAAVAALLAACAPVATREPPAREAALPPDFPVEYYRAAAARGERVLRIDTANSRVVIEVRREGSLAHLGHDHVVASRDVAGYVLADAGRADLAIPLAKLTVDEPELRTEAGLDTQPSAADIAGTRRNMLASVLDAERHPYAVIHVVRAEARSDRLAVAITLHGVTQRFDVPARIEADAGGIVVSGRLSFDQSAFRIVPFSVLGGALAVRDRLDLRFRVRAVVDADLR